MDEILILVDDMDRQIGFAGKSEVHKLGLLHRAFSIFVFNSKSELILQRRAKTKYHSAGLWTNTCCGHPIQGETILDAANRRLGEEMNMKVTLEEICTLKYRAEFQNGLIENEIDHIFYGVSDDKPDPNPVEVGEWKYIAPAELIKEVNTSPEIFTEWFKIAIRKKLLGGLIKEKS